MDFLKKFFGEKDKAKEVGGENAGATFVCESCGQTRPESQKKAHTDEHAAQSGEKPKNVCEFC